MSDTNNVIANGITIGFIKENYKTKEDIMKYLENFRNLIHSFKENELLSDKIYNGELDSTLSLEEAIKYI